MPPRIITAPVVSNMTGKIGSHICTPVADNTFEHVLSIQSGFTDKIIDSARACVKQALNTGFIGLAVSFGHPDSEREYTRGQISFSSITPSASVSVRAKVQTDSQRNQRSMYFFMFPCYIIFLVKSNTNTAVMIEFYDIFL
jgi:hypothetical protein